MTVSLEINWIRKYDKSLPLPELVFCNTWDIGGGYYRPTDAKVLHFNQRTIDNKHGTILINPDFPDNFESVIAHEWRHHWQYHKGLRNPLDYTLWNPSGDWKSDVFHYFTEDRFEFDALMFERKFAPSDLNEQFWDAIDRNCDIKKLQIQSFRI